MNFKKWALAALATMLMVIPLSGCGKKDYINFDDVYNSLTQSVDFSASNMQKMTQTALDNYYYIDTNDLENGEFLIYMSDPATGNADEIAMFHVKDSEKVVTVRALIQDRINDLTVRYEAYKPTEVAKIKSYVLVDKGNYVFMVISPDNAKAKDVISKL